MRILLTLGIMLFASSPALADPQVDKPKQDPGDKMICISEAVIGSHMSDRVCHTKREWDATRQDSQHEIDLRNGELRAPKPKGAG
jgi:hypothetical protein